MIVVIYGPDAASARTEVDALLRAYDPTAENTSRLDGRIATVRQIIVAVGSVGFFGATRIVVVDNLIGRATKPGKAAADADDDASPAGLDLGPLFDAVPETNVLVLVESGLVSLPVAVKKALPASAQIRSVDPPRGNDLVAWLVRAASDVGANLDRQTARFLAERVYPQTWSTKPANPRFDRPPDLDLLRSEVDKLATAAHPGPITRQHVQTLVASGDDDRVFRFVEAAANGDLRVAAVELSRLQDAGEEPYKLAAQIYQQVELAAVLDAAGGRVDPATVGRALGLSNPNRMVGIASSRRGGRGTDARAALSRATLVDRGVKSGRLRQPDDAVYHLMTGAAKAAVGTVTRRGDI